jgi:hypothetical protein
VSGPLRPAAATAGGSVALPRRGAPPFVDALRRRLRGLPDHRWLDRLIGGRAWIPLVGVALVGIVAMQVSLLRMNAGIGRAVDQGQTLQRENAALSAGNAELANGQRLTAAADKAELVDPTAGSPRFLRVGQGDAARAAKTMTAPSATTAATTAAAATQSTATATTSSPATTPTAVTPTTPSYSTPSASTTTPSATATTPTTPTTTTPTTPSYSSTPSTSSPYSSATTTSPSTTATSPTSTTSPSTATGGAGVTVGG